MIGSIESYDAESQSGIIKSELVSYPFNLDDWIPKVAPDVDDEVSFTVDDGGHSCIKS